VHRSADGDLLVIGGFIVPGDRLEDLDGVIAAIEAGGRFEVNDFDLDVFIRRGGPPIATGARPPLRLAPRAFSGSC
jgi:hypothetical protein